MYQNLDVLIANFCRPLAKALTLFGSFNLPVKFYWWRWLCASFPSFLVGTHCLSDGTSAESESWRHFQKTSGKPDPGWIFFKNCLLLLDPNLTVKTSHIFLPAIASWANMNTTSLSCLLFNPFFGGYSLFKRDFWIDQRDQNMVFCNMCLHSSTLTSFMKVVNFVTFDNFFNSRKRG